MESVVRKSSVKEKDETSQVRNKDEIDELKMIFYKFFVLSDRVIDKDKFQEPEDDSGQYVNPNHSDENTMN